MDISLLHFSLKPFSLQWYKTHREGIHLTSDEYYMSRHGLTGPYKTVVTGNLKIKFLEHKMEKSRDVDMDIAVSQGYEAIADSKSLSDVYVPKQFFHKLTFQPSESKKGFMLLASKIKEEVLQAQKSNKPVVFLGGSCEDNQWREDLEKEFGDKLFLFDPYDEDYKPEDNTYDEIAGMIQSDYVIFYRGGEQTAKEKKFLKMIRKDPDKVKVFSDLDKVRYFLKGIKIGKISLATVLRKISNNLLIP